MPRRNPPTWLAVAGLALGSVLLVCGILSVFGETSLLSPLALLCGVLLIVPAALFLFLARVERDLPDSQLSADGAMAFCLTLGLASPRSALLSRAHSRSPFG